MADDQTKCPWVETSDEGTHFCRLAENEIKRLYGELGVLRAIAGRVANGWVPLPALSRSWINDAGQAEPMEPAEADIIYGKGITH